MQKLKTGLTGLVFLALLGGSSVRAQNDGGTPTPHSPVVKNAPLPPHRQPREADVPDTAIGPTSDEKALEREEKVVDRKINNICRGC
jgi:hypothetical protein